MTSNLVLNRPATKQKRTQPAAGFWLRFCAFVLDLAVLTVLPYLFAQVLRVVFLALGVEFDDQAVAWLILGLAGIFGAVNLLVLPVVARGQTIGKRLTGLRIISDEPGALSVPTVATRHLLGYLLSSILLIGFISVALDGERQGWHDKLARTRVIVDSRYKFDSLFPAIVSSVLIHLMVVGTLVFLAFLLPFLIKALNIPLPNLTPPEPPSPPLEYTLIDKPSVKTPPKTQRRANVNSVAGGKRDPKRPVSAGAPAARPKAARPQPQPQPRPEPPDPSPRVAQTPPEPPKPQPKPQPLPVAPDATFPKPRESSESELKPLASAPTPAPAPSPAPAPARRTRSSAASALGGPITASSGSTGTGSGGSGNSGVFNPDRDGPGSGIDAAQDVDFGPYMAALQRKVKRNWIAPEAGNSRRSVLIFSIARSGELLNLRVGKTSGSTSSDQSAMEAVRRAAPFANLPSAYKGDRIDIQFTFDINVFGADSLDGLGF